MSPELFQRRMEKQSDEELLDILEQPESYQPEAIEAARSELARRNIDPASRLAPPVLPLPAAEDLPQLPKIWIGFALVGGILLAEILSAAFPGWRVELRALALVGSLSAWIYWLFCVSRFHSILNALAGPNPRSPSGTNYPISAHRAVSRHFLPVYNLYWICHWPGEMERYLKAHTSVRMASGSLLGLGLLVASTILGFFDGFLSYSAIFGIGAYIAAKLRQVVREHVEVAEAFA